MNIPSACRWLLPLLTLSLLACATPPQNPEQKTMTRLTACPDRPNCVSSKAPPESDARVAPLEADASFETSWQAALQWIEQNPRATLVDQEDGYVRAEFKSRLFGFIDDLELEKNQADMQIEVRSASRSGYYDFGVNRRRVDALRQALQP